MRTNPQDLKPAGKYRQIIFTGCGSTYYLALAAAALTQELTGAVCRAFPASELWLSAGSSYVDGSSLLVAVSRSGETTETLRACEAFLDAKRGELLTFSCYGEMPLAGMGSINIVLPRTGAPWRPVSDGREDLLPPCKLRRGKSLRAMQTGGRAKM
jgi:fructoselysine-6-P-deglycase FrlB-like protein